VERDREGDFFFFFKREASWKREEAKKRKRSSSWRGPNHPQYTIEGGFGHRLAPRATPIFYFGIFLKNKKFN
jgi:hypothetical protein